MYRVRRIYFARAVAWRSVDVAFRGVRTAVHDMLDEVAAAVGTPAVTEGGHTRLWLAHRVEGPYPQIEQFFVPVPATVVAKQRPAFDPKWAALAEPSLVELDICDDRF